MFRGLQSGTRGNQVNLNFPFGAFVFPNEFPSINKSSSRPELFRDPFVLYGNPEVSLALRCAFMIRCLLHLCFRMKDLGRAVEGCRLAPVSNLDRHREPQTAETVRSVKSKSLSTHESQASLFVECAIIEN